jgi:hypothetical protein
MQEASNPRARHTEHPACRLAEQDRPIVKTDPCGRNAVRGSGDPRRLCLGHLRDNQEYGDLGCRTNDSRNAGTERELAPPSVPGTFMGAADRGAFPSSGNDDDLPAEPEKRGNAILLQSGAP